MNQILSHENKYCVLPMTSSPAGFQQGNRCRLEWDREGNYRLIGSSGNDQIRVFEMMSRLQGRCLVINVNGEQFLIRPGARSIAIQAGEGNDSVVIDPSVRFPLFVEGGPGNDYLKAGSGPVALLGGRGNDVLVGGPSTDLLLGGSGADRLIGSSGNDLFSVSDLFQRLREGRCGVDQCLPDDPSTPTKTSLPDILSKPVPTPPPLPRPIIPKPVFPNPFRTDPKYLPIIGESYPVSSGAAKSADGVEQSLEKAIYKFDRKTLLDMEKVNSRLVQQRKSPVNLVEVTKEIEQIAHDGKLSDREKRTKMNDVRKRLGLSKGEMKKFFTGRLQKIYSKAIEKLKQLSPLDEVSSELLKNLEETQSLYKSMYKPGGCVKKVFKGVAKTALQMMKRVANPRTILSTILPLIPGIGPIAATAYRWGRVVLGGVKTIMDQALTVSHKGDNKNQVTVK